MPAAAASLVLPTRICAAVRTLQPHAARRSSTAVVTAVPPAHEEEGGAAPIDPVKLAFAKAKAYRKAKRQAPEQSMVPDYGSDAASTSENAGSGKDNTGSVKDVPLDKSVTEELKFSAADFMGLEFFEKRSKRYVPAGLIPTADYPWNGSEAPEVQIIVGDPTKFEKNTTPEVEEPRKDDDYDDPNIIKSNETMPSVVGEAREDRDDGKDLYKPKVSTWGMFPRPKNISKTFGGGRTIRPGEVIEKTDEKDLKEEQTRKLIEEYQTLKGLKVDAKTKADCEMALQEGDRLMKRGDLKEAALSYEKAMKLLPFKNELHGMAALQWSICIDSLGRSSEARTMYEKLKFHPTIAVSMKAKNLAFSFQAMEMMKVTSSSASRRTEYDTYFDAFIEKNEYRGENSEAKEPEKELGELIMYMAVILSPVFVVLFLAFRKLFI